MLAALTCKRAVVPLSRVACARSVKVTTNLVGLDVVPNAPEVLTGLYNQVSRCDARKLALASQTRIARPPALTERFEMDARKPAKPMQKDGGLRNYRVMLAVVKQREQGQSKTTVRIS